MILSMQEFRRIPPVFLKLHGQQVSKFQRLLTWAFKAELPVIRHCRLNRFFRLITSWILGDKKGVNRLGFDACVRMSLWPLRQGWSARRCTCRCFLFFYRGSFRECLLKESLECSSPYLLEAGAIQRVLKEWSTCGFDQDRQVIWNEGGTIRCTVSMKSLTTIISRTSEEAFFV
jgi:hypothetical protein